MVTVYLIRHCEAQGNLLHSFQGTTNTDITPLGSKQLEALANRFKNIRLDAVYSSPLKRAYKTALSIAQPQNLDVTVDNGLIEIDGGVIEGMKYTEIFEKYPEVEYDWEYNPQNFATENGEPMRSVYDRIWKTVYGIAHKNSGKTVAVASHGGAIRCLLCRVVLGDIEKLRDMPWSDNTAVAKLIFDDNLNCTAEYINDSSHLSKDLLPDDNRIKSLAGKRE